MSRTSALNLIKEFAKKIYEKPAPSDAIIVELDEMWHYLGSKRNELWIWKAYQRETGKLIDWECGGRDKETFKRLVNRLLKGEVELFCTDNWAVYQEVIDEDRLFQSKTQSCYLEQNNGRQRHWHVRLRRKSIVVSKTLEMVDPAMALFARFHVMATGKSYNHYLIDTLKIFKRSGAACQAKHAAHPSGSFQAGSMRRPT